MTDSQNNFDGTKICTPMTDRMIGKTVRQIVEQGYNVIVKKNKNGIIIMKEKCEIVKKER